MSKKAPTSPTRLISQALGITVRRTQQLRKKGMPDTVAAARKWFAANVDATQAKHVGEGGETLRRLRDARAEAAEIDARRRRLEVAKLEGQVIDVEVARNLAVQSVQTIRTGYRVMESLYAQAFALTPEQRAEWAAIWDAQEMQISSKLGELGNT
jgi:hypothetical protein